MLLVKHDSHIPDYKHLDLNRYNIIYKLPITIIRNENILKKIFLIKEIKIDDKFGLLKKRELNGDNFIGHEVNSTSIFKLLSEISSILTKHGYITSYPILLNKNISSGIIRIKIKPGKINDTIYVGKKKISSFFIPNYHNDIFNIRSLDQEVYNQNQVGNDFSALLTHSKKNDYSNIEYKVPYQSRGSVSLFVNNNGAGNANNGLYNVGMNVILNRPLFGNDAFNVSINSGIFTRNGVSNYSISPDYSLFYKRFNFNLSGSYNKYSKFITGMFGDYSTTGSSLSYKLKTNYTFYRTHDIISSGFISIKNQSNKNFIQNTLIPIESKSYSDLSLGVNISKYKGTSSYFANLSVNTGLPVLKSAGGANLSGVNIFKNYVTLTGNLSGSFRFHKKNMNFSYNPTIGFQFSNTHLLSAYQFSIGGQYNIMGYNYLTEQYRDNGVYVNNVFNFYPRFLNWGNFYISPTIGVSYGLLYNHQKNNRDTISMAGTGIGATFHLFNGTVSVEYGIPLLSKRINGQNVIYLNGSYSL